MIRTPFIGGWYIDALPSGEYAVLLPGNVVDTHLGSLYPPAGQTPLYTCITTTLGFQIAGQAWQTSGTTHYYAGSWHLDPRIAHGNFGCIFDLTGRLQIIEPAAHQTSQGYRYVYPDGSEAGRLVLGDETILQHGVSAYTDLSAAQNGSFLIGQGHASGGVVVYLDGQVRELHPGECYAVRAHRQGDAVSVAFYEQGGSRTTAHRVLATVAELAALPPVPVTPPIPPEPPEPEPIQPPPLITVHFYEPLLKAGVPWAVDFSNEGDGTRFVVSKDEHDQLWIEAQNDGGETATGLVRQLTVEGPDEPAPIPPEPPTPLPPVVARFWCHPNIGSPDLLQIFEDPANLDGIEMFGLYVQSILSDTSTPQLGDNIYPNLVAHDVFRKLLAENIPLRIEMGAVKAGDCQAQNNIAGMQTMLQRVADAGGVVTTITMDEPLTSNQQSCGNDISACAEAVAAFIHSVAAIDETIAVGWVEAWPEVAFGDHATLLKDLADRHALPRYWHLDIDWQRAEAEHRDPATFIRGAQELCDEYGITLGVLVNATVDPLPTDVEHHRNLLNLSEALYDLIPEAAHVVVQSWCTRTGGTQDIPYNLGLAGLLSTFAQVRERFDPTPAEETIVLSTYVDPSDGVIPVKEVKAIHGDATLCTLILPDDRVFSCQPDGSAGSRPPGTDGGYERCRTMGNLATFQPVPGEYYSWPFVLVGGL